MSPEASEFRVVSPCFSLTLGFVLPLSRALPENGGDAGEDQEGEAHLHPLLHLGLQGPAREVHPGVPAQRQASVGDLTHQPAPCFTT